MKGKKPFNKKLILFGLILFLIQITLMTCTALFFGTQINTLLPAAEIMFVEEYKQVGQKAMINWAEMLIYDTIRYDNNFEDVNPKETVFDFLVIEYERREKVYSYTLDEEGNVIEEDYTWETVEKSFLYGKDTLKNKLRDIGYSSKNYEFDEIVDAYKTLNNGESFIIIFSGKDLEDLMDSFTDDQLEWANLLISENYIFEMFGGVFDLPENIPVAGDVKFAWPTPTLRSVTSPYGWRIHPVKNVREFHYGIDIAGSNAMGQPIIAVRDGEVFQVNYTNTVAGYNVRIKHIDEEGNEWESRYSHMSQIIVKSGTLVKQGDVIGAVGNTGRSTGPHLHFELRFSGQLIDPYPYINY